MSSNTQNTAFKLNIYISKKRTKWEVFFFFQLCKLKKITLNVDVQIINVVSEHLYQEEIHSSKDVRI